jgi:hypothetical protein
MLRIARTKLIVPIFGVALLLLFITSVARAQTMAPVVNNLSPNSTPAAGPNFSLTVNGANFLNTSVVLWNGSIRATTFVSPNVLLAEIPAADILAPSSASVSVMHQGSTLPQSNTLSFTITPPANPAPVIDMLAPNMATAGGPAFSLLVTGANFNRNSTIRWNNVDRPTTFISSSQLSAMISASDIASSGVSNVSAFNPAPGTGSSNVLPFTINPAPNAPPTVSNLSPNSTVAGTMGLNLTLTGSNFVSSSTVRWNGQDRQTIFVTPNQLTAIITAADLAAAATANVTVFNPAPGGGTSNVLPFNIETLPNPFPNIVGLSPDLVDAGGPGFLLTITGAGFNPSSQVRWNGMPRPTTFISATQLTIIVSGSDTTAAGHANITVFNPAPGGGTSNAVLLSIKAAPNTAPVITNLSPDSARAGGPGFPLILSGAGFTADSVVRWNGSPRATSFISPSQLTATISAADIASAGVAGVTVVASGMTSNNSPFSITNMPAPAPTLSSISITQLAPGARHVSLILVGSHFRPGARVSISQTPENSSTAGDTVVESVTRISDSTIIAQISVSERATAGVRHVDVVNADNSTTGNGGTRTSKPLRVDLATSLAAPLAIRNLIITNPHDGALVAQGDEIYPEAMLAGTGTGTVSGQWLWDGNVIEQFFATFTGGLTTSIKGVAPLPTVFLGVHTLELRINSPNTLVSQAFKIVVNPGTWKPMRLLDPGTSRGFAPEAPPMLRWSIIPGALRYQVGFASEPYFTSISQWYDVSDTQWQVPEEIWSQFAEGELYWTVRAVELGRETSKPARLRRIWRVANDGLIAVPSPLKPMTVDVALLRWNKLSSPVVYRVTVYRDAYGKQVLRRALSLDAFIIFRDTVGVFQAGQTYWWQVEAFSNAGHLILAGPRQHFVANPGSVNARSKKKPDRTASFVKATHLISDRKAPWVSVPGSRNDTSEATVLLRHRAPAPKQVVHDTRPVISIEFRTRITRSSFSILLDNTDVSNLAQLTENKVSFKPLFPLENGLHAIEVNADSQTESWEFVVERKSVGPTKTELSTTSDSEAESEPATNSSAGTAAAPVQPETSDGRDADFEVSSHSQWVSGNEIDNNLSALAAQASIKQGPWRAQVNGTGLINSLFSTRPKHALGQFNDYVLRLAHDQKRWATDLRFGTIAPQMYSGAEFMATAYPRQGTEAALRTLAGTFSFYANAFDKGGRGEGDAFAVQQKVSGFAYQMPALSERVGLRFMWLRARDNETATTSMNGTGNSGPGTGKAGSEFDLLFSIRLGKTWRLTTEYAFASNNLNSTTKFSDHHSGRAWRSGLSGNLGKTNINLAYRVVTPDFANPVTASLGQLSAADRRGLDASLVSPTRAGVFSVSYQLLQSDVHSKKRPPVTLNNLTWNWSRNFTNNTIVTFGGNFSHTGSSDPTQPAENQDEPTFKVDHSRFALNSSIRQTFGRLSLTVGGSRNWFVDKNNNRLNNVMSALTLNSQWHLGSFFQLQTNFSANWIEGDKFSVGKTRSVAAYIQPVLSWRRTGLTVSPLVTISQLQTTLGPDLRINDILNVQYGGRLSWQMPGRLNFSTLSFEGSQSLFLNRIQGSDLKTPRLLVVWTLLRTSKRVD